MKIELENFKIKKKIVKAVTPNFFITQLPYRILKNISHTLNKFNLKKLMTFFG